MTLTTVPSGIVLTNQIGLPLALTVLPGAMSPVTSTMAVSLPEGLRSGSPASIALRLADAFNNAVTNLTTAQLVVTGAVTGPHIISATNLTATTVPGNWSHSMTLDAIQNMIFELRINGAVARGPFFYPAAPAVAERAVDFAASVRAAALQSDGANPAAPRSLLSAAGPIASNAWHVVHVPVARLPAALGPFVADPGLTATIKIQPINSTSGAPDAARAPLLFTGEWSWSNGTYVVPLKLAADAAQANTTFSAAVTLIWRIGGFPFAESVCRLRSVCVWDMTINLGI